jgi:hypothetical protein
MEDISAGAVIADVAYASDAVRDQIDSIEAQAVILSWSQEIGQVDKVYFTG